MDDNEIISLYFSRSNDAIGATAEKYGAYLRQIAYNILRSGPDADEVVNDVWMAAWNAMPPMRPRKLKYYLARGTRNLALNRLDYLTADRRSADTTPFSELEESIPHRGGSAEEEWEAAEVGKAINRFLSTLSGEDAAVFLSRYYYARTNEETGRLYGLSLRRVKYILARTRKKLRAHLEREGVIL